MTAEEWFGSQVRIAREARQWSQEALARTLRDESGIGIDQAAVARLERGKRAIRLNEAVALARIFGIALDLELDSELAKLAELAPDEFEKFRTSLDDVTRAEAEAEERQKSLEAELDDLGRVRRELQVRRQGYELLISEYERRNGQ